LIHSNQLDLDPSRRSPRGEAGSGSRILALHQVTNIEFKTLMLKSAHKMRPRVQLGTGKWDRTTPYPNPSSRTKTGLSTVLGVQ
jgi:hypothetical protein